MKRHVQPTLMAMLLTTASAFATPAPKAPPSAPAEVAAAAPAGTALLSFAATTGSQTNADAMAVFETAPDKDDVRHRTLVMFGKKDGKFVPDFSNDKIIACSRCSQFHDDPWESNYLKFTFGHLHLEQMDGGEKPSTTFIDLVRQGGIWRVTKATRDTVVAGREKDTMEKLPLPASGLAKDMDAKWSVPVFLNTLLINRKNGKFAFLHGDATVDAMWKSQEGNCNRDDCAILVQQQDGCISLVRDASGKSFGGANPDRKNKKKAVSTALDACNAAGGKNCEEVRTDCSKGIL